MNSRLLYLFSALCLAPLLCVAEQEQGSVGLMRTDWLDAMRQTLEQHDTNHDTLLQPEEMPDAKLSSPMAIEAMLDNAMQNFLLMDHNKDGFIATDEMQQIPTKQ